MSETTTITPNDKETEGQWLPLVFPCQRDIPRSPRSMPLLCFLRNRIQAENIFGFPNLTHWRLQSVSTNVGFAIGSPDTPRTTYASDQIRVFRVAAYSSYLIHYIYLFVHPSRKPVAILGKIYNSALCGRQEMCSNLKRPFEPCENGSDTLLIKDGLVGDIQPQDLFWSKRRNPLIQKDIEDRIVFGSGDVDPVTRG